MRIGIVTATYLPSKNGVSTSTALLARGLQTLGHRVRIFAPRHPHANDAAHDGLPEVVRLPAAFLPHLPDYPLLLPSGRRAARHLGVAELDVVHAMHPFVAGRTARAWAQRARAPLVYTAHTQYHTYSHYLPIPEALSRRLIRGHVRDFAARADLVLVPGRAMLETLREYGYDGEAHVLPNPVDLAAFEHADGRGVRERYGVPADAELLVFLGRIASEKNLDMLFDAFRRVRATRPHVHLLLVGDGPYRPALERRTAEGVRFAGAVEPHCVAPYLAAADLFVSASVTETGTPMTFLEAFAAGTPVVAATGRTGNDVVRDGENGRNAANDPAAFAQAVTALLEHPDERARLQAGARATARRFDVLHAARALERHYRDRLERRHARSGVRRRDASLR